MSSNEIEASGAPNNGAEASGKKLSFIGKIVLFVQQVFAELKKVTTPTRKELVNFTLVVLGFVVVMMALVWALDRVFSWLVLFALGTPGF